MIQIVGDTADGSIYGSTLQADLETLYGSGNVTVSPSGAVTSGSFTVTFVGDLAAAPLSSLPYIDTSGLVGGGAYFARSITGTAGTNEVQTITLPSGLVGGTWQINGGSWQVSPLPYDADAYTVEHYLDSLLGQTVYVYGDNGGPYTVNWALVGPQDLLDAQNIDLQVPNHATVTTTQPGASSLTAHIAYDPYGKLLSVVDANNDAITSFSNLATFSYAGYHYDAITQTYVMPWRDYDPQSHTFLNPDPSTGSGSNRTRYVGDDPINLKDSSGLMPNRNDAMTPKEPKGTGVNSTSGGTLDV